MAIDEVQNSMPVAIPGANILNKCLFPGIFKKPCFPRLSSIKVRDRFVSELKFF